MKVRLLEINETPSHFRFQITRSELGKLEDRFVFETLECEAQLLKSMEFIELKGQYRVQVKTDCDFCLEPALLDLEGKFRLDLVAEGNQPVLPGDFELSMNSPEMDTFNGEEIFLPRYFEDQLILDMPYNIRCSEDCKGLCTVCGGNLNHSQCNCHETSGNSPFSILKDLKSDS